MLIIPGDFEITPQALAMMGKKGTTSYLEVTVVVASGSRLFLALIPDCS